MGPVLPVTGIGGGTETFSIGNLSVECQQFIGNLLINLSSRYFEEVRVVLGRVALEVAFPRVAIVMATVA
ncbi:hypothetical protein CEXT_76391 [Caerostris extrusa]|uniref:Uncharacterized protein n=1 Tax=Caerostris extrusa TaxID=172846 RepID=A0AAV4QGU7_CAEEX|nr:hypothetical protein CEXT_76391 [Caerostris extrusa]